MASFSFDFGITVATGNVVDQEQYAWTTVLPLFSVSDLWLHLRGCPQCCTAMRASLIISRFCLFSQSCAWFRRTVSKCSSIGNMIMRRNVFLSFIFTVLCVFQTGCSPTSAFASFSKHPASPPRADRTNRRASGVTDSSSDTLASNITSAPQSVSLASDSPTWSPLEGDVVIPCEFCGVALEEAVVFHHQVCHFFKSSGHYCRKRS